MDDLGVVISVSCFLPRCLNRNLRLHFNNNQDSTNDKQLVI